ncbi:MAG: aldo/keto reductase [Candidatus Hydrogenedentes bacterium]|jgi:aryl-alcohol dehydrogenase-like predicted oxidoreductase|nr:aldo/keto reductase [Candidatus Hydrogenedentota bacterium]
MQYRQLGNSDLKIPVVSFGAWAIGGWMWGGTDDDLAIRAIHGAIDHGMTLIDTAPVYGMGHSERVVGEAVKGRRDQVIIATKCGLRWDDKEGSYHFSTKSNDGVDLDVYRNLKAASIRKECEDSLRRLNVDHIDLYQCHWPDPSTPIQETMEILTKLQQEGKIRAFGVSNFSKDQLESCLKWGRIVSDQPRYSALDRSIEEEILPFCRENNIGILAYSPLEQGLLTGKVAMDRNFKKGDQRRDKKLFEHDNRLRINTTLEFAQSIANRYDASLAQIFLAWLIAQDGVTSVLAGTRNEAQMKENAGAGELKLTEEDCAALRRYVESLHIER